MTRQEELGLSSRREGGRAADEMKRISRGKARGQLS